MRTAFSMRTAFVILCLMVVLLELSALAPDLDEEWEEYKLFFTIKEVHVCTLCLIQVRRNILDAFSCGTISFTCHRNLRIKRKFNKFYEPDEDAWRYSIWKQTVAFVAKHNRDAENGLYSFTLGMNPFSDMTDEEFSAGHTGLLEMDFTNIHFNQTPVIPPRKTALPRFTNWVNKGVVTEVKNQMDCGSCWAFAAVGAIESQYALKTGKLVSLSEQNLLDCVKDAHGCDGGHEILAFEYVIANGGIATEASYSYEGVKRECRYDPQHSGASISSYEKVWPPEDERALMHAVATKGPITVSIHAENVPELKSYKSGIFSSEVCMGKEVDHAVLVVGYGTMDGENYWLIKNSWGKLWGNEGYLYLQRNTNMCGVATEGYYPII